MRQFDRQRCALRNRIAARRDYVDAAQIELVRQEAREELAARGVWPAPNECLARINAMLPEGAPGLSDEDVYIHLGIAANSNLIPDRYLFLADSTLKNCARACNAGVSFMNSHRTGGLSHPAEQPFGKTFWGKYKTGAGGQECLFGIYMLRGVAPAGQDGPTTDDLNAQIEGGTAPDVSVGLFGGQALCDVCGEELDYWDGCGHVPGTHHGMSDSDKKSQKARGVPDGRASYSLHDASMAEVSSVYDGAVPGAGFRKALSLASMMDAENLALARQAYHLLARDYDFAPGKRGQTMEERWEMALAAVDRLLADTEEVRSLREQDGRSLPAARWEQLDALRAQLDRILAFRPAPPELLRARAELLRLELETLHALGATA